MKILFDPQIRAVPGDFGDVVDAKFHAPVELRPAFRHLGIQNAETLLELAMTSPEDIAKLTNWSIKAIAEAAELLVEDLKEHTPEYFEVNPLSPDKFGFGARPLGDKKTG